MARFDGVKLIGKPSGGSACSVATFSDGSGTIYNMSMSYRISYPLEDGSYTDIDDGNAVDFELDESYWYDLPKLSDYLNSIDNNA